MEIHLNYRKLNLEQINELLDKLGGMESVKGILAGELEVVLKTIAKTPVVPTVFHLTVDYSKSIEQMIAAGHYDWVNEEIISERFPNSSNGIVECEARYFYLGHAASSGNAIKVIEDHDLNNPWMPANIEHILSLGTNFPNEQRLFPIVALGSIAVIRGDRDVPYLYLIGNNRRLDLRWWEDGWSSSCRFLAVRDVSKS